MTTNKSTQLASSENLDSYSHKRTGGLEFVAEELFSIQTGGFSSSGFSFTDNDMSSSDLHTQLMEFSSFSSSKESRSLAAPLDCFPFDVGQDVDWSLLEGDQWFEHSLKAPGLMTRSVSDPFDLNAFDSHGFQSGYRQAGHETDVGVEFGSPLHVPEKTPSSTECSASPTVIPQSKALGLCSKNNIGLLSDDQCWHAVSVRSRAADQLFVYGVQSTKIYCRPSCPSRRPSRRHARFFLFPGAIDAAEKANFRACKRCKPKTIGVANAGVLGVGSALEKIAGEINWQASTPSEQREDSTLETLAKAAGLSTFHFHRLFKTITRMTPGEYMNACHSLALQDALGKNHGKDSRTEAEDLFSREEYSRWSARTARKALGGISPAAYAQGAKEVSIEYTRSDTAFGRMCVAWSKKNRTSCCCEGECSAGARIHALLFGEDSEDRTRERFPLAKASNEQGQWLRECVQILEAEGKDRETELPAGAVPLLRRAKVWLNLVHDSMMGEKLEGRCTQERLLPAEAKVDGNSGGFETPVGVPLLECQMR